MCHIGMKKGTFFGILAFNELHITLFPLRTVLTISHLRLHAQNSQIPRHKFVSAKFASFERRKMQIYDKRAELTKVPQTIREAVSKL